MNVLKAVVLLFGLMTAGVTHAADPINSSTFGSVAIDGYDTVAYWTQNKAIEGTKKFTYKWKDAKWRFASEANMNLFKADPEKYVPQYGGYCAWAMSDGKRASVDGDAWTMHDGKLYLNYNKKVMKEWRADKETFIPQADDWYPKVVDL